MPFKNVISTTKSVPFSPSYSPKNKINNAQTHNVSTPPWHHWLVKWVIKQIYYSLDNDAMTVSKRCAFILKCLTKSTWILLNSHCVAISGYQATHIHASSTLIHSDTEAQYFSLHFKHLHTWPNEACRQTTWLKVMEAEISNSEILMSRARNFL